MFNPRGLWKAGMNSASGGLFAVTSRAHCERYRELSAGPAVCILAVDAAPSSPGCEMKKTIALLIGFVAVEVLGVAVAATAFAAAPAICAFYAREYAIAEVGPRANEAISASLRRVKEDQAFYRCLNLEVKPELPPTSAYFGTSWGAIVGVSALGDPFEEVAKPDATAQPAVTVKPTAKRRSASRRKAKVPRNLQAAPAEEAAVAVSRDDSCSNRLAFVGEDTLTRFWRTRVAPVFGGGC